MSSDPRAQVSGHTKRTSGRALHHPRTASFAILACALLWAGPLVVAHTGGDLAPIGPAPKAIPAPQATPAAPAPLPATAFLPHGPTGVHVTSAPPMRQVHAGPDGSEDLSFVCPDPPNGLPVDPTLATSDLVVYGCPYRIYDNQYSLGNAAIALPHDDHTQVVFTSLHGGASAGTPYDHSRDDGQVHTTFTSQNQGVRWFDQPPRQGREPSGQVRGTDNDVALDSTGHMYIAYLYHDPVSAGHFDSIIGMFKAGQPRDEDVEEAYARPTFLHTRDVGNHISRIHITQLPAHVPARDLNGTANETADAANETEFGDAATNLDFGNATSERIVSVWHESTQDPRNSTTGLSGWIDAAWTHVGPENEWTRLPEDQVIGPCSAASNPIHWEDEIYVACVVDKGYGDRARARIGDVDLWAINPHTNTTRLVADTGMATRGNVSLAQSFTERNTYVGLLTQERVRNEETDNVTRLQVYTAYAWLSTLDRPGGRMEIDAVDYGIQLRQWGRNNEDIPLNDAHVTAFSMTDDTYQSLLVYNEWHDAPQEIVPPVDPDADGVTIIRNRLTDYNKFVMAFNTCDGVVAGYQAELGTAVDQYNSQQYQENPGIFNEPRDGLYKTREAHSDEELLYFAIGDYGAMQYGAIQVTRMSSFCSPPPPPPFIPAAAIPQALTVSSGVSSLMAASFGVPAVAMIGYLLTVKRRKPHYVTAEDE